MFLVVRLHNEVVGTKAERHICVITDDHQHKVLHISCTLKFTDNIFIVYIPVQC